MSHGSTRVLRLGATFVAAVAVGLGFVAVQFTLSATRTVVQPPRHVTGITPSDFGLPFERVSFPSPDGLRLSAWFIGAQAPRLQGFGPGPVIVLGHGHGGSKQDMLDHAVYLHEAGYSVLLLDFRAMGESDGEFSTLGYYEWQDLVGAVTYLKTRTDVDPNRLGLLGVSMGASAALQLGVEARHFKAILADSSFATAETMVGRFDRWFKLPSWPFSVLVPWAIERQVGIVPSAVSPVKAIERIRVPVLIIHGEQDAGVPPADAHRLYAAAREPKGLWIVEGAAHGGAHGVERAEYERRALDFFGAHVPFDALQNP